MSETMMLFLATDFLLSAFVAKSSSTTNLNGLTELIPELIVVDHFPGHVGVECVAPHDLESLIIKLSRQESDSERVVSAELRCKAVSNFVEFCADNIAVRHMDSHLIDSALIPWNWSDIATLLAFLTPGPVSSPATEASSRARTTDDEPPELAFYCSSCAEREFRSE